jgi:hypothetical protein
MVRIAEQVTTLAPELNKKPGTESGRARIASLNFMSTQAASTVKRWLSEAKFALA